MDSKFYDEGALRQAAINLFHGWGYNFYRTENQLRADDQLVRTKAGWLLGMVRSSVEGAEAGYRREFIGTPSRDKPFPSPSIMAAAQKLERLGANIGVIGGRLQSQPVPENDRMTQRYRQEADTLKALISCDERLVGQCSLLHAMLDTRSGTWILEHLDEVEEGLAALQQTLRSREAVLLDRAE
ncbi:hypothetical protein [Paraburkholderia domus]|uniref:Uncharacterized protein n=1 Tax=Paraburkholderia domus TaxID=2793075 RepID=A0A9N8N192_9BURK|nr:hypothetical protein [Paraburkholderia domus]MBK5168929.1 hypothetical protein [Burkholderia sp. R-70211]CAE6934548.1 hypothetical protein R70211_05312 [Paraburkholderia domus]